jgi:FkbM family methyltransferase
MKNPVPIIKRVLRPYRRPLFEALGSDRYSHLAINELDRQLAPYLDFRNGSFIECGGNDGLTQSNTYWFERFRGWRGIMIEAAPELAAACRRNRPRATVINAAMVASSDIKSVKMASANLMGYVHGSFLSLDDELVHRANAIKAQRLDALHEIEVPARTLASVLDDLQVPETDFFSLDVEGYEVDVLQGMDIARNRPRYILVETKRINDVLDTLEHHYAVANKLSHHDFLLALKDGHRLTTRF